MLYIMVLAALIIIPIKLGGYGRVFSAGQPGACHPHAPGDDLPQAEPVSWVTPTLAIGSALALMLYPHTATAVL